MTRIHNNQPNGSVRIIGGHLRGSKLQVADLPGLRPTADRVRETLFNWLAPMISGAHCLDLFAGTGALGFEAASRGAAKVTFVERDRIAAKALADNLARLKVENATQVQSDALVFLRANKQTFDLVFIDPPFADGVWESICAALEDTAALSANAWIYLESPATMMPPVPKTWQLWREGKAGEVRFALYKRSTTSAA